MDLDERLTEVFDRGVRNGVGSLGTEERELFRIQDFILEYEMSGLSGCFYNRLPDLEGIRATVAAMRRHGLRDLAGLLEEAVRLFVKYVEPKPTTTWARVVDQYDPKGRLRELDRRVADLKGYGLGNASDA